MWNDISLWFWLAFPWWLVLFSIFSCTSWQFTCLLWKWNIHSVHLSISNQVVWFIYLFCYFAVLILYVFWYWPLITCVICKYFLPFHELSFCFAYGVLWCTNVLNFDEIRFIYFFFCCLCFWCHIQEIVAKPVSFAWHPASQI